MAWSSTLDLSFEMRRTRLLVNAEGDSTCKVGMSTLSRWKDESQGVSTWESHGINFVAIGCYDFAFGCYNAVFALMSTFFFPLHRHKLIQCVTAAPAAGGKFPPAAGAAAPHY